MGRKAPHYTDPVDGQAIRIRPPAGEWVTRAACRGVTNSIFYPNQGEDCGHAKRICARCPVADECLEHALVTGEKHGVWGGVGEMGRRKLRKQVA